MALWLLLPAELILVGCLLGGVPVSSGILLVVESVVVCLVVAELILLSRVFRRARRSGLDRAAACRAGLREVVPEPLRRLIGHETRAMVSLALWVARRRHGVRAGDHAVAYAGAQASTMFLLTFAVLVETVVLALLIPWPVVHLVVLVLDLYGVLFVLATHAACVVRPHVVGADGALRVRYGAFFDLRVSAEQVAQARIERGYPTSGPIQVDDEGVLTLSVGNQTSLVVELTEPVPVVRPLGRRETVRVLRFHADDPRAALVQLTASMPR
ncbi:hypothetical protein [Streptomyces oceani]|uniref:hypothetical protein n=1 Tax=Streptomyces oceani TaxID=1075402 RepID=UPI001FCD8049|nr:hypothetical protein [Streptomyces oceani]